MSDPRALNFFKSEILPLTQYNIVSNCAVFSGMIKGYGLITQRAYTCHARLRGYIQEGFEYLVTTMFEKDDDDKAYHDWILGPDSPWISVVPEGSFERLYNNEGRLRAISFLTDEHCIADPVLFYNFLIASRQANDGYKPVPRMMEFKRKFPDLPLSDCYWMGVVTSTDDKRGRLFVASQQGGWHTPIFCSGRTVFKPSLLRNKTPIRHGTQNTSNDVWGVNRESVDAQAYKEKWDSIVRSKPPVKKFGEPITYGESLSYEQMYDQLKEAMNE